MNQWLHHLHSKSRGSPVITVSTNITTQVVIVGKVELVTMIAVGVSQNISDLALTTNKTTRL